jgi:hypothetical protein
MTFNKFLGGLVLIGGAAYLGYLMDVPTGLIIGLTVIVAICCLMSGL